MAPLVVHDARQEARGRPGFRVPTYLSASTPVQPEIGRFDTVSAGILVWRPARVPLEFVPRNSPLTPFVAKRTLDATAAVYIQFINKSIQVAK